jgi:hypothetical protein
MVLHFPQGVVSLWLSLLWPFSGGFHSRFRIPNMYGAVACKIRAVVAAALEDLEVTVASARVGLRVSAAPRD